MVKKNWRKRVASFGLAAAIIFGQLGLGVFGLENIQAEELTPEEVTVQDGDFTGDFWNDKVWKVSPSTWDNATFEVYEYANNSNLQAPENSTTGFHFWMQDGGTFTLTQTIAELPAGTYTISSDAMGKDAEVSVTLGGKTSDGKSLTGWGTWDHIENTFTIDEAKSDVTIGFSVAVNAGGWGYLDCLKISGKDTTDTPENPEEPSTPSETLQWVDTTYISNGDFESGDTTGWTLSGDNISYEVNSDSKNATPFLSFWNGASDAVSAEISQNVTLPAGTYKLCWDQEGLAEMSSGLTLAVDGADTTFANKTLNATNGWGVWTSCESDTFTLAAETSVTICFAGDVPAGYWGKLDNIVIKTQKAVSQEKDTAVDADVYVKKIDGLSDDFITGADVSSYYSLIQSGAKFYDANGQVLTEQGFFDQLKAGGTNYIRLRVWNDPYNAEKKGYGGGNNDLEAAKVMGQYATKAGMRVLIDFHYSDFWADPDKQQAPKAWSTMSAAEKAQAVSDYTTSSLKYLLDNGVDVGMVQVGNETTNAICGVSFGENTAEACAIFDAGCDAVHAVAQAYNTEILAAIHFTNPEKAGTYATFAKRLADNNVSYDVFASSYYPYWHGTISNLTSVLKNVADTYDKKVMVAETSWAWTLEDGDGHENTVREGNNDRDKNNSKDWPYDFSVQGQCTEIAAVAKAVADVGENGIGLFYWENAWIPVSYVYDADGNKLEDVVNSNKTKWEQYGSGWASSYAGEYDSEDAGKWFGGSAVDNQAWFDFNGKPLSTLNIYNYIRTGTNMVKTVTSVKASDVEVELSDVASLTLPDTATVKYNTGESEEVAVAWDTQALASAVASGIGSYTIHGNAIVGETSYTVKLKLTIAPDNLLLNPGFENGLTDWKVSSNIMNTSDASTNSRTGTGCLHFYTDKSGDGATASQTVTLAKGVYQASAFLQGNKAGSTDVFALTVQIGEKTYQANGTLDGWKAWSNPTIESIVVDADNTEAIVTLSISDLTAGVWGSFDDVKLIRTGDVQEKKPDTTGQATTGSSTSTGSNSTADAVEAVAENAPEVEKAVEEESLSDKLVAKNVAAARKSSGKKETTVSADTAQTDSTEGEIADTEVVETPVEDNAVISEQESAEASGNTSFFSNFKENTAAKVVVAVGGTTAGGAGAAGAVHLCAKRGIFRRRRFK